MITKEQFRSVFPWLVKWDCYGTDKAAAARNLKIELGKMGIALSMQEGLALFAFACGRTADDKKVLDAALKKVEKLFILE